MYFLLVVCGISCVYRLKMRGAVTESCGTPLSRVLQRNFLPPMCTWKRRCDIIDIITRTTSFLGNILNKLSVRPRFHAVSYAVERSTNTTPAFSFLSKTHSISSVSETTWFWEEWPGRKPACYLGRTNLAIWQFAGYDCRLSVRKFPYFGYCFRVQTDVEERS